MRILLWPQPSMRSYENGLWQLEMDPQLNKNRAWANQPSHADWHWILPSSLQCSPESDKAIPESVFAHNIPWSPNVMTGRLNFPWDAVERIVRTVKPDAMVLEVPEHGLAMRMVQEWTKIRFPIFSYINYLPLFSYTEKSGVDTWERLVEGCRNSDTVVFNTKGLAETFLDEIGDDWPSEIPITIWKAVYSPAEVDAHRVPGDLEVPAVFFTSRLTDPRKNRNPQFFDAIGRVAKKRAFQTWIGDPNRALPERALWDMAPNVTKVRCSSREEYLRMINQAAVSPTLWAQDQIYSIGYCDVLAARTLSIVSVQEPEADVAGIKVSSGAEVDELENALSAALDIWDNPKEREKRCQEQREWLERERGVESNFAAMMEEIKTLS